MPESAIAAKSCPILCAAAESRLTPIILNRLPAKRTVRQRTAVASSPPQRDIQKADAPRTSRVNPALSRVIANAAGGALGELKAVSEGDAGMYSNVYEDNAGDARVYAEKAIAGSGTSVHAAQISVTANVQLTYELR